MANMKKKSASYYSDRLKQQNKGKTTMPKSNMPTGVDDDPDNLLERLKPKSGAEKAAAGAVARSNYVDTLFQNVNRQVYTPGANYSGMRRGADVYANKVGRIIGAYGSDTEGKYKPQMDMDIASQGKLKHASSMLRARSGDMNVLNGLDEDDPQYALYKRLLRLSGYDDVTRAYGATELPEDMQRDGLVTYEDLFNQQQGYSLNQLGRDLQDVEFLSQGAGDSQRYVDASGRIADYFGGDWSADAVNERMKAGGAGWYNDVLKQYGLDTDALRAAYPLDDKGHTYDGYVEYMQGLAKQKKADEEAQARYNEWKAGFDSKWGNLSQAEDYDSYVRQRYYPNQYGGGWSEDQQLYENIVYGLYTKTADDTDLLTQGTGYEEKGYHMMTPEERDAYAYLFNQRGADTANEYLSDLQPELWRRRSIQNTQTNAEWADKNAVNGVLGAIAARGGNLMNDVTGVLAGIHSAFGGKLDAYDPIFDYGRNAQTFDSVNSQNIREATQWANIGNVNPFQIAYGGLASAVDSILAGGLFGATGGSLAQAAGAGSTALREGLESGKSYNDALMDAIATGAFEGLTEKFSMDALFKGGTSGVKNIVRNMLTEPSEEVANMLLNLGYDRLRYGTDDDLGRRMNELVMQGYTESEARVQMLKELGGEALETILTAVVAGGAGGTVSAASTHAENKGIGKQVQENETTARLLEIAEGMQDLPEDVRALIEDQKAAVQATQEAQRAAETQDEEMVEEEPEAPEAAQEAVEQPAEEAAEAATEETSEPAKKRPDTKKKTPKLDNAKLGRIYRETMSRLDEQAQNVLADTFGVKTMRRLIDQYSALDRVQADGPMRDVLAKTAAKAVANAASLTDEELNMLRSSKAASTAVREMTAAVIERGEAQKTAGELMGMATKGGAQLRLMTELPEELAPDGRTLKQYSEDYGKQGDIMLDAFESHQDVGQYAQQFRAAFNYGRDGRNVDSIIGDSKLTALTEKQIRTAYELGRDVRKQNVSIQRKANPAGVTVGNVDRSAISGMQLNSAQHTSVTALTRMAKIVGFNLKLVASTANAEGKYTTENGSWDRNTRTLTIDINAGRISNESANYAMMQTAGHELTHYIKQFADSELYDEYQEFVLGHLSKKMGNTSLDARIASVVEGNAKQGKTLTREQAIDEIVADASGDALMGLTEADLTEMAQKKPGLLKTIGKFFEKWINSIKTLIRKGYEGQSTRNAVAEQMLDVADELGRKWAELLKNAQANAVEAKAGGDVAVDANGEVQFSLREDERLMSNAIAANGAGNVPANVLNKAKTDRTKVAEFMRDDSRDLNLPADLMGNTFFSDAAYGGTEENTTVCPRSIGADAFLDAVSDKIGRPLTVAEQVLISQDVIGAANIKDPQCIYCYVAADRAAYREYLGRYIEQRDGVIDALKSGETDMDALYQKFLDGRKDTPNMKARFKLWVNTYKSGKRLLSNADLANIGVLTAIQSDKYRQLSGDSNYAAQMKDALAYAQSASWAKKRINYVAYNGHILKWTQNRIDKLNSMYGLRMYSFSDFSPAFALENMQMVTDASVRGLKMLAYTKVPAFAEIFADTGMNINISVFATEVQGDSGSSIVENNLMGADWKAAQKLRDEHENIGITFVATSDAQVEWALAQPWIDVCIPYHLVRTGRTIAEIMKYKNFTAESGDTKTPAWSKASGNLASIPAALHNNDRDTYMRLLAENNLEPRFARFVDNPNYMKLVNETRQSVTTSKPVQPVFNTDAAINALQDMANNGGYYVPIGGSEQRMYELADEFADKVKGGAYAAAKSADVQYSVREQMDADYLEAYEAGDEVRAREIIHKAAIAAGYNPMKLYHGTTAFGFTKVDPQKSDDGISFFVSDDDLVGETYAGEDARIRRISSANGMTIDRLLEADGETLLQLLHKHIDSSYQLVGKTEARKLAREEGELLRLREIPKIRELIDMRAKSISEWGGNDDEIKAAEAVIESLDRMSYASSYDLAENLYIAYDDAMRELLSIDSGFASTISYTVGNEVYRAYNQMQFYLSGDLFKVEYEWSEEFTSRTQAMDMLIPKLFRGIYELYGRTDNLLEVNAFGGKWNRIDGSVIGQRGYVTTREVSAYAKANGYDGVFFRDIVDVGGASNYSAASNVLIFYNPEDVKSADPFTFDDNGNVIPPSQRFDRGNDDIRFSVRDVGGTQVVWIDDNIMKGKPAEVSVADYLVDYMTEHVGEVYRIIESGQMVYLGSDLPKEYAWSKYSQRIRARNQPLYRAKARMASGVGEAINVATNRRWEKTKHPGNKDAAYGIYKYDAKIAFPSYNEAGDFTGVQAFDITLVIRNASNGRKYLYDIQNIKKDAFTANTLYSKSRGAVEKTAQQESTSSAPIVAEAGSDVNLQIRDPYQLTDREILANTMESVARNKDELDILRRYKARAAEYGEKQAMLETINANIARLTNEGGERDELIKERNRAQILRNQIDRLDQQLAHRERTEAVKALAGRERQRVRAEQQKAIRTREVARLNKRLDDEKAKYDRMQERYQKQLAEQKQKVKDVRDEKNESFAKAQYRAEVQKHAKRLMDMLTTPTNKAYVPEFLRRPLADFITALDFSTVTKLEGGADTKGDERLKDAMSDLATALRRVHNQQFGDQTTGAEFFGGYLDLPGDFLDTFDELMAKIRVSLKTSPAFAATPVNKMTSEQLHDLAKVFRLLHSSIANMNRLISNAKYASAVTAANDTMTDLEPLKDKRRHSELAGKVSSFLDWKNTVPYYVFKRFGRGGTAIFEGLMDGWDKLAHNSDELVKFTDKAYNVSEVREWEREVHTVELASGNTVSMTTAQMMSVYCLAKREQARGHLLGGGIRIADIGSRGKVIRQVANHLLTDADLKAIAKQLTPRQREVADALQEYMNTKGSEWGNYVSMKRFGYEMFTEEHYFPIETDPNNRAAQDEKSEGESLYRLLNMSATKALTKGANNAIVVRSIFDVFTAHMTDMAKYNALGLQLLDTFKWFNYVERTQNKDGTVETRTTQKALEEAYGGDARSYVMQFLKDLNGVHEGGRDDAPIKKLISNYKIAATAANIRVGILQVTSMPRAAYAINPKYLLAGLAKWNTSLGKTSKAAAEEIGIAKWKSMGFYDTNISRSVRQLVKHDETGVEKVRGWSTKLAEWGDAWTMGVIYGAVEAEMKDKHGTVKPGTKAYKELFNRRMREIIYQTQVVDSTMTRSQLMRDTHGLMQLATSFMSEPTLAMNMLNDAIFEAKTKARAGHKGWFPAALPKVTRAFGATTFVIGVSSLIEAFFTAFRDDDEFETFAEKYVQALWGENFWDGALGGNINLLNNLPLVKDIIAATKGNGADTMWTAAVETLSGGITGLWKVMLEGGSQADIYRNAYKTLQGASQLSGLAVSGAVRDLVALYNTVLADGRELKRLQTYENTPKDAAKAIYAAAMRGDTDMVKFYRERAALYGIDEEDISKKLEKLIEDDIQAGKIDSATAGKLLKGEAGKRDSEVADILTEAEYFEATGLELGEMKQDFIDGNITEAQAKSYLKEYGGKRDSEADKTLNEWKYEKDTGLMYSKMKLDYVEGVLSASQVRKYLMQYGGKTEEKAEETISGYDYYIATGKDNAPKYWRIAYAHETGGNYRKLAEDAIVDIVAGGRTEKQARRQIADSLESYYKADYLAVEGTPAGTRMLEDILDVYEAIGFTRDYERNYIAENWFD